MRCSACGSPAEKKMIVCSHEHYFHPRCLGDNEKTCILSYCGCDLKEITLIRCYICGKVCDDSSDVTLTCSKYHSYHLKCIDNEEISQCIKFDCNEDLTKLINIAKWERNHEKIGEIKLIKSRLEETEKKLEAAEKKIRELKVQLEKHDKEKDHVTTLNTLCQFYKSTPPYVNDTISIRSY